MINDDKRHQCRSSQASKKSPRLTLVYQLTTLGHAPLGGMQPQSHGYTSTPPSEWIYAGESNWDFNDTLWCRWLKNPVFLVFSCFLPNMEMSGDLWRSLEISGDFWRFLEISGDFWWDFPWNHFGFPGSRNGCSSSSCFVSSRGDLQRLKERRYRRLPSPVEAWKGGAAARELSMSRVDSNGGAGWWFGTFFIFPYIGNNHPNWLIFFRGVETTNQIWSSLKL